jgi:uncharacterized membrane protein
MRTRRSGLLGLLVLAAGSAAAQAPFIVGPPAPLDGDYSVTLTDVSADGRRVVGTSNPPIGLPTVVFWDDLGPATAIASDTLSSAVAISGDGSTILGRAMRWDETYLAQDDGPFQWTAAGGIVSIGTASDYVNAISFDGSVIVGWSWEGGATRQMAVRWTGGVREFLTPSGYEDGLEAYLRDVSSTGRVIGDMSTTTGFPFVSDGIVLDPLYRPPGVFDCQALAISNDGSVWVGLCNAEDKNNVSAVFPVRWSDRDVQQVAYLDETNEGMATDVSANGDVVVGVTCRTETNACLPFVWTLRSGFRLLTDVLEEAGVDTSGVPLFEGNIHVSADGRTVVGPSFIARLPEPDPVPESGALQGGAAALLALIAISRPAPRARGTRTGRAAAGGSSRPVSR